MSLENAIDYLIVSYSLENILIFSVCWLLSVKNGWECKKCMNDCL